MPNLSWIVAYFFGCVAEWLYLLLHFFLYVLKSLYISSFDLFVAPKSHNHGLKYRSSCVDLSYDNVLKTPSYDGEVAQYAPPLFFFMKTIEKVIRLCTVLKKKKFEWEF